MPRKRLTKRDETILTDLVERYSPQAIVRAALKIEGAGSKRLPAFHIWMFVEIKREGGRLSASRAAELVSKDQKKMFGDNGLSARRVREIYADVEAMRKLAREEDPTIEDGIRASLENLKECMAYAERDPRIQARKKLAKLKRPDRRQVS